MPENAPNLPRLYELVTLERTDSSRAHAERLAARGSEEGTLVWAKSQEKGIGRKGNYWMSGNRNLHCALILRPKENLETCCQLSLLATVCAAMAISRQAEPLEEFRYRWPNDIVLNQGKVAGITLSGHVSDCLVDWLVVALNVNVYDHPHSKGLDAASMRGEGFRFDRIRLLEDYSREFLSWLNRWSDEGFEPIRKAWMFKGHEKNDEVKIKMGEQTLSGAFEDIKPDGAMLVKTKNNSEIIGLSQFFSPDFHFAT